MEKIEFVTSWNHRPTPIRPSKRWKDVKVIKVHRYRDVDLGEAPCGLALDVIYERRKMQPHELSSCHSHRTRDRALLYIFAYDRGLKILVRESFDIFASDNTRIFHCDLPWQVAYGTGYYCTSLQIRNPFFQCSLIKAGCICGNNPVLYRVYLQIQQAFLWEFVYAGKNNTQAT